MDYNPFSPEVQDNPYPYYAYLRQHAPVYQISGVGAWAVSRYDSPIQFLARQAMREVEVASTTLPAGAVVLVLYGSANRDEHKFPEPERFDTMRNTEGHIGFGFGVHFCLGAELARLEAKVALAALLGRFPHLSRRDEPVTRIESFVVRGVKTLPLTVG